MDQSDELALSTFEGIDGATAGNYRAVISWYGASFPLTFDVMCGNGMVGPVNTGRMRQEPAWNYTSTSTMGLWSSAYSAILGCNKALTAINEGKFSRNGVSDEQINNIKAENLFLRALAYFDLVRVYAQPYGYIKANGITGVEAMGVPIVLKDDLSARPSRNTVAEVYENLIIPDLVEAERLMSDSYVRAGVKDVVATVTKPVIQALMARVYLHHEDWQLAADYATKVIKNGRFRLLSGDRFVSMWDGSVDVAPQSGSEIIFEVYVSQSDGSRSDLGDYLTAPEVAGRAGYGDVRVSNDLIDLYDATDVRLTGLTKTNSKYPGYRWSTKYPGKGGLLAYNNVPVLRISEMYLIRSEAIYRGATVSGVTDIDDLNRVATNRNAEAYATVTLDNLFDSIQQGEMKELNIIVKADVQGSAEAVKQSLEKISNDEVRVRVIHAGVGAISKSDVDLADASNAIIIGFNVRPDNVAKEEAAATKVEMRMYRVIYDAINDVTDAMKGMLAPKFREVSLGELQVRQVYKISNVGTVAGCRVTSGKITRDSKVRVVRDGIVITEDEIASLKRFKDDAKEVAEGYECGVTLAKFADVKEGDVYEAFKMEEYRD